jgi:hypothetical protein
VHEEYIVSISVEGEEGFEHNGVILSSVIIVQHERPNQALRGKRTSHQDFLGMQSGFVKLMLMLSDPETHFCLLMFPVRLK